MPTRRQQEAATAMLLLDAISTDHLGKMASLLAGRADPNIPTTDDVYPLHFATFLGRLDMVKLLVGHGAKGNAPSATSNTPLHAACVGGHLAIAQVLLAAGANPNEIDKDGCHPLHWVAREGSTEVLRELIRAGAQLDTEDNDGYAPIHHAADTGNFPALHLLVRAGSSHAWRTNASQTPLVIACFNGHSVSVKYLIDQCHADPGVVDDQGFTPIAVAAQQGHLAVVKILLSCGVNRLGTIGYPDALNGVSMSGKLEIMRELVRAEGGVHVKGVNTTGKMTPLHFAAGYCHPLATSMLLRAGGDETAANNKGKTPADIVDTLRHEAVKHGVGRRRVRHMLGQAPAYRARSWGWPNTVAVPRSPAVPTGNAEESTERGAGLGTGGVEPAEMSADSLERVSDFMAVVTPASSGEGKAGVTVLHRPIISSSWSATGGDPVLVASLVRYSRKK